mmetsp:Transcript_32566/g.31803  ORF Transcript_32566/g.31803 Transcript_32566/m.31803 type:complete len:100 (-) Transcript_32566:33-332(-)
MTRIDSIIVACSLDGRLRVFVDEKLRSSPNIHGQQDLEDELEEESQNNDYTDQIEEEDNEEESYSLQIANNGNLFMKRGRDEEEKSEEEISDDEEFFEF